MYTYLPENLDLFAITTKWPPSEIKDFDIEKLKYFLGLINSLPNNRKDFAFNNDFIPLYSRKLKSKAANYYWYFQYAIRVGVIETDGRWIKGSKSIGFRFTNEYLKPTQLIEILNQRIRTNARKKKAKRTATTLSIDYAAKYFSTDLTMNIDSAREYARQIYEYKSASKENRDINWEKTKSDPNGKRHYKNPLVQHNHLTATLDKVERSEWNLYRDPTVNRLHSTLTQLPASFRNLLTYRGDNLVACDIKNSQPYILSRLLQPNFYFKETDPNEAFRNLKNPFNNPSITWTDRHVRKILANGDSLDVSPCDRWKYGAQNFVFQPFSLEMSNKRVKSHTLKHITQPHTTNTTTLINWQWVMQGIDIQEVDRFCKWVSDGRFYEEMLGEAKNRIGLLPDGKPLTRQYMKVMMFQVLFSDNRFYGQKEAMPKQLFSQMFPSIYELVKFWKPQSNSPLLATTLQSIESYIILDVVCKRFAREYPDAPIFTIHDSVVTTRGHEHFLKKIMEEELTFHIGLAPSIKLEYWTEENFFNAYPMLSSEQIEAA